MNVILEQVVVTKLATIQLVRSFVAVTMVINRTAKTVQISMNVYWVKVTVILMQLVPTQLVHLIVHVTKVILEMHALAKVQQ